MAQAPLPILAVAERSEYKVEMTFLAKEMFV